MIALNSIIGGIDFIAALLFVVALGFSAVNYRRVKGDTSKWLMIALTFIFLLLISLSNTLEWGGITDALDPAEDFIFIVVVVLIAYIVTVNRT